MFYVFSIPAAWSKWMAFNCGDVSSILGVKGSAQLLFARVLGMGWLSSVGVAQHLIRQLVLRAPKLGAGLNAKAELRRDKQFPTAALGVAQHIWQVYLDDFDEANVGRFKEVLAHQGQVSEWQQAVREVYAFW